MTCICRSEFLKDKTGERECVQRKRHRLSLKIIRVLVAQWWSIVLAAQKVMGSIPREHTY